MFKRIVPVMTGLLAGIVGAVSLISGALAFPLISGDGSEACAYVSPLAGSGTCSVQTITAHPLWMPDNSLNAKWISYGPTGYQDAGPYAPRDPNLPLFRVSETFTLTLSALLSVSVWADDTAEVFIDGVSVFAPNFTQSICANGSIGCEPGELGFVSQLLAAGSHTVGFEVYQIGTGTNTGSNPFGLLYTGSVEAIGTGTSIAEAPAALLILTGLMGVGLFGGRRRRAT
jgi:hypothetical protein